jgi:predicted metal-dependent hydrolase
MLHRLLKRTTSKARSSLERTHAVAGRELPLKIVENERARRLTLRIAPGGAGLRVTIPPGLSTR